MRDKDTLYHIMIIDDEKSVRENTPLLIDFPSYGFEPVMGARNGEAALELLQMWWNEKASFAPDLILLDVAMPAMNGLEFLKRLQAIGESGRDIPYVIVLSGYSDFEYARTAMRYGAIGYLTKPLDLDEATSLLQEARKRIDRKYKKDSDNVSRGTLAEQAVAYIENHYHEQLSLQVLADNFHVSPAYIGEVVQSLKPQGFKAYFIQLRIDEAKQLLETTDMKIWEIADAVGYTESKYFISRFTEIVGISPEKYRKLQSRMGEKEVV